MPSSPVFKSFKKKKKRLRNVLLMPTANLTSCKKFKTTKKRLRCESYSTKKNSTWSRKRSVRNSTSAARCVKPRHLQSSRATKTSNKQWKPKEKRSKLCSSLRRKRHLTRNRKCTSRWSTSKKFPRRKSLSKLLRQIGFIMTRLSWRIGKLSRLSKRPGSWKPWSRSIFRTSNTPTIGKRRQLNPLETLSKLKFKTNWSKICQEFSKIKGKATQLWEGKELITFIDKTWNIDIPK